MSRAFALAMALLGCERAAPVDLPGPEPALTEFDLDDELVEAVLPPHWHVGQTWTVETEAPIWSGSLNDSRPNGMFRGFADYRVDEVLGNRAVIVATARRKEDADSLPPNSTRWVSTYTLDPFMQVGLGREGRVSYWKAEPAEDCWVFLRLGMADTEVLYAAPATEDSPFLARDLPRRYKVAVSPGLASWSWSEPEDVLKLTATRTVHWRPGDPWWSLAEGLDKQGRPFQQRYVPARGRLVAIDGVAVEPMPWTD